MWSRFVDPGSWLKKSTSTNVHEWMIRDDQSVVGCVRSCTALRIPSFPKWIQNNCTRFPSFPSSRWTHLQISWQFRHISQDSSPNYPLTIHVNWCLEWPVGGLHQTSTAAFLAQGWRNCHVWESFGGWNMGHGQGVRGHPEKWVDISKTRTTLGKTFIFPFSLSSYLHLQYLKVQTLPKPRQIKFLFLPIIPGTFLPFNVPSHQATPNSRPSLLHRDLWARPPVLNVSPVVQPQQELMDNIGVTHGKVWKSAYWMFDTEL